MIKNGAVIFFSGTGNTKYIAKLFKDSFKKENINVDLIDIQREDSLNKEYDFYIFGGPIHAEMIPKILVDWVNKNIPNESKKCLVYHTLASEKHSPSRIYLAKVLNKKGLDVIINTSIQMPNNYYHKFFKRDTDEEIARVLSLAPSKVDEIVKDFITNNKYEINFKKSTIGAKTVYDGFLIYAKKYAKRNFSLDESKCINCKICENECPTKNISMKDKKLIFSKKCIGCEKCIHRCPTNAILFDKKPFTPYKIEKYLNK
ncbi:MAG: EFR1 family ferrodoxin [Paraclostridium sp.]|uniref:EFR1 family ferrodoxin n=1 Tax=Paraclostridium sp. TaxID=2023273 RepID=UPI003F3F5574